MLRHVPGRPTERAFLQTPMESNRKIVTYHNTYYVCSYSIFFLVLSIESLKVSGFLVQSGTRPSFLPLKSTPQSSGVFFLPALLLFSPSATLARTPRGPSRISTPLSVEMISCMVLVHYE